MPIEPYSPITRAQAATILQISLSTLDGLVKSGVLPAPRPLGHGARQLYWHPEVFYGCLERALREDTQSLPESAPAVTQPATPVAPAKPAIREETTHHSPAPRNRQGSASARARNAARVRTLNE
jgi:hypothetical protein